LTVIFEKAKVGVALIVGVRVMAGVKVIVGVDVAAGVSVASGVEVKAGVCVSLGAGEVGVITCNDGILQARTDNINTSKKTLLFI
jgi:hypothetical protein